MINFFTLILLALLVLLEVILVTTIFKNVTFSSNDKHYKNKVLMRDILEVILLVAVIFLLVYKYLEFMNVSSVNAYKSAMTIVIITIVVYVFINYNFFKALYNENFSNCDTVEDVQGDQIKYLSKDKVFSMVPAQARAQCSGKDMYAFGHLYPFHSIDIKSLPGHREEMVEKVTAEFNDKKKEDYKLVVIPLDQAEHELVANS